MKTHTLYKLQWRLPEMEEGDFFRIKGQGKNDTWVYYDINKDYFFIKNTCTKQIIAIQKLRD